MDPHGVQSDAQTMSFEYASGCAGWIWSERLRELCGLSPGQEPTIELMLARVVEQDRPVLLSRLEELLGRPGVRSCVCRVTDHDGRPRRVVFVGESRTVEGSATALTGFVVDLTEPFRETARAAVTASAEHRAAIEQAKGVLMVTFGVDEDGAFELLRAYSSQHNIKLAVVAQGIVAGVADGAFSRLEPVSSLLDIVMGLGGASGSGQVGTFHRGQRESA